MSASHGRRLHERRFVEWLARSPLRESVESLPPLLSTGRLRCVFQPLVDLRTRGVFAYEALCRSDSPHYTSPPPLFEAAIAHGVCGALGRVLRELAVESCPDRQLFLNLHPHEFDEGWLVRPDDPIFQHDHAIFLEITESVPLTHFAHCHGVLAEVRHKGVSLAVDDLGAGYSNLKYITDLAPDIVKLDRGLVTNLDQNKRGQKLVHALVRLSEDLGAKVVAEGVETREEARAVTDAGVHYGQGYFFAYPGDVPPTELPKTW